MRVKGPCFSTSAAGRLGQTLVFRRSPHGVIVELRKKQPDPRAVRQISQRAALDLIARLWRHLPLPDRLAWASLVPREGASPYHAFVRRNLQRWRGYLAPIRVPGEQPPAENPSGGGLSLDVAANRVDGRVYVNNPADGIAIFFHRSKAELFHCNQANLIHAIPLTVAAYYGFTDSQLAPGRYFYRHRYANPDASWSVQGTARAADVE
jgi:hypothetical protein